MNNEEKTTRITQMLNSLKLDPIDEIRMNETIKYCCIDDPTVKETVRAMCQAIFIIGASKAAMMSEADLKLQIKEKIKNI